jgi:osmotically inducible protein OsmC
MVRVRRRAHASWQGTVAEGGGRIGVASGIFDEPFTLRPRVEDGVPGTNPEELIGAAHAGCYTMSLANVLEESGHPAADLQTTATVHLDQTDTGFSITRIALETVGDVPGISDDEFAAAAEQAKATCPVSQALAGVEITLSVRLGAADA